MISEQKRRMMSGELYHASDEELVADRLRCQVLLEQFNATSATDQGLRQKAGAVVTLDLPPQVLAAGNPARVIRDL